MKKKNDSAMNRKHLMFRATWSADTENINGATSDSSNKEWIKDILFSACEEAGAHVRSSDYYSFFPCGITATVILAESHATVTSWPENREALFDYFSCANNPGFEIFMHNVTKRGLKIDDDSIVILDR